MSESFNILLLLASSEAFGSAERFVVGGPGVLRCSSGYRFAIRIYRRAGTVSLAPQLWESRHVEGRAHRILDARLQSGRRSRVRRDSAG